MSMEGNNSSEFKNKSLPQHDESSKSGPLVNQWQDKGRDRKNPRLRSPDTEWSRDSSSNGKDRKKMREDDSAISVKEESHLNLVHPQQQALNQQQQPLNAPTYSTYGYGNSEHNNYSMMPPYMYPMNHAPWPVSSMEGMSMPSGNLSVNPCATGMEMATSSAGINGYPFMGMSGEAPMMMPVMPNMGGYVPYPLMNGQDNVMPPIIPQEVKLSKSTMYPPKTGIKPPTREKPPGCKTVYVGGLPEKITEEIIREAFDTCGEIVTIRMSKKNFCHIRFADEHFMERALLYSGYRIKIEDKDETSYSGRLHVDYAVARDDQYEYECLQRAKKRADRHKMEMEQQAFRPPTPPTVHYSEVEATTLAENLRSEENFKKAVQVLITWLERGECNKRNSGTFYSMLQSTNSHVRRLLAEKGKFEEEVTKAKENLRQKTMAVSLQFNDIEKVFEGAALQKVWDHFTKAQRRNIEIWKKHTSEIKKANLEELLTGRIEDEMEVSDGEDEESSPQVVTEALPDEVIEERNKLREDIDLLRNELNAFQYSDSEHKEKLIAVEATLASVRAELEEANVMLKAKIVIENSNRADNIVQLPCVNCSPPTGAGIVGITEREANFIGLICTFLHVHPFGASIEYICSYLTIMDDAINTRDIETLMRRFPTLYRERATGIGATLEKKWNYLGFTR